MADPLEYVVLMREDLADEKEPEICKSYFDVKNLRTECQNKVVIGRYSCLPYYEELYLDLVNLGSCLINTVLEHKWIADFKWYQHLKQYTPRTWSWLDFRMHNIEYEGPFVVKGCTNSKKFKWNKLMYAETKRRAVEIACDLSDDTYIGDQQIIFREYVPLETYELGSHGLPFTNEWRMFFLGERLVSCGYYWSIADKVDYVCPMEAIEFAKEVAKIAAQHATFFVLDVARTVAGDWILIEVNDGQQSGLSENSAMELYSNLKELLHVTH